MENWLPNITGEPPEAAAGKRVDIMMNDGYVIEGTDADGWSWHLPHEGSHPGGSILAWRLREAQEPVRESHTAEASLFEPDNRFPWCTGYSHRGKHHFYLHFDTVDGKIDYDSMRATELPD